MADAAGIDVASKQERKKQMEEHELKKKMELIGKTISKAKMSAKLYPSNLCVKYLVKLDKEKILPRMTLKTLENLFKCAKSGLENADSNLGSYAMNPKDYEDLSMFFDLVINDYHKNPKGDKVHETNWSLDGIEGLPDGGQLDLRELGVKDEVSMRVRVGRNLRSFPLPGSMTKADRINFESQMLKAFDVLKKHKDYGGNVFSLTPHDEWQKVLKTKKKNPNFISESKYEELVAAHVMFKDMAADPYLASAGIASDWPCGRGCYQSKDGGFIIWFGEEDQLRIMCMAKGFLLNSVFDRLNAALQMVESIDGIDFATSEKYGYVTSCPSNLGTGMRASLHLKLPNLTYTKGGGVRSEKEAKKVAKALGLSVRGVGGEHTPIGDDGTVDISPSNRLFISEAEIITALYNGTKLLLEKETAKGPPTESAENTQEPKAGVGAGCCAVS